MPQQGFGQQRAALPNQLWRYARMHTCNPWLSSNTWHKRMPHDSPFLSVGHSVARKSRQRWSSLCQGENLSDSRSANARISLKQRPVDVRLRRNEGREAGKELFRLGAEKATSSDCKTVFSSQTTQRQCCSSSLEGRSDFMSPAKHTRSKEENAATNLTKVVWVDARLVASAAMMTRSAPASQLVWTWRSTCTTRVMNIPFERAHQGSDMVTFKRNWPSFAVLV